MSAPAAAMVKAFRAGSNESSPAIDGDPMSRPTHGLGMGSACATRTDAPETRIATNSASAEVLRGRDTCMELALRGMHFKKAKTLPESAQPGLTCGASFDPRLLLCSVSGHRRSALFSRHPKWR